MSAYDTSGNGGGSNNERNLINVTIKKNCGRVMKKERNFFVYEL